MNEALERAIAHCEVALETEPSAANRSKIRRALALLHAARRQS